MLPHVFAYGMSRSGTTLLSTILDSHPDISMGYELMTKGIDHASRAAEQILDSSPDDPRACSAALEARGLTQVGVLVHRADRALVSPQELAEVLQSYAGRGQEDLTSFAARIALASAIVDVKSRKEGTRTTGFKLNAPRIGPFDKQMQGDAAYVFILRDPRDVWRSHIENGFDRDVEGVAGTWTSYLRTFEKFAKNHAERCHLVRYEDLVASPTAALDDLCDRIGLPRAASMDKFNESKASVLRGGHANSEALKQDFFTTSVGRWRDELSEEDLRTLESLCYEGMDRHGYERVTSALFRFPADEWDERRADLRKRRKYFVDEYADLVLPAVDAIPHLTWAEATKPDAADRPRDVLLIRHDIDQDIENAVALARWEAEHGIRATYCVLHSAWYYGRRRAGRVVHRSQQMVEGCLEIQSLGHEINLHNNTVVTGLRSKTDPYDVLADELSFLRGEGLDICGTSTHGDRLCGELGFQNLELFSECVYPARGGARTLTYDGHSVDIGHRSMSEFDLDYEGYDLPRDIYISDSGGRLVVVEDTAGRAGLHRSEMDKNVGYRRIVGILVHPVWWELSRNAPEGRPSTHVHTLVPSLAPRGLGSRLRQRLRLGE